MKKRFIFLLAAWGLTAGASASRLAAPHAQNWPEEIRAYLDQGDVSRGENNAMNTAQPSTSKPETLALIAVGLIGLGIKRRQQS